MVSKIGLQFGRWKVCEKMEWLGGAESLGLLALILLMVPFPKLDVFLPMAGYIYLIFLFIAFLVAFVEKAPS